jgi:DNA helicase HerA-like ATPase
LADLTNEKFGAAGQKVLIPAVVSMIKKFMKDRKLNEDSLMGPETKPLIKSILDRLSEAKLRADAAILAIFNNLVLVLEDLAPQDVNDGAYDTAKLVNEILDESTDSPKLFVINLPEADVARYFCSEIIDRIFRKRKSSFTLIPRIVFVFDEAQEFIPAEKRREDGTDSSSRAVERLLRHGRKYNLNGWISTQRIAHLNTNALQQLHSYFVSTMPRPYDRQLISDTFAIDDAFMDRTLIFQNGDWLMTSFKATNTQNVPVFFHAINNDDFIVD